MSRLFFPAVFSAFALTFGGATGALACADGAKCIEPAETAQMTAYATGDTLPRGRYNVLLNSEYYGLPPAQNGAWYFRVDERVMRVNPATLEVLEDVTDLTNRAF